MAQLSFKSPGVALTEVDVSGPTQAGPVGTPAGVIGTAQRGPAFVPVTVGSQAAFRTVFGDENDAKPAPIAAMQWLKYSQALTFVRVLGIGTDGTRQTSGDNAGRVPRAGFVVGDQLPVDGDGPLVDNPYANAGGPLGRVHFLGCYMSESAGSTIFSEAGIQTGPASAPILRGVIMAPSGVVLTLAEKGETPPAKTLVATSGLSGFITGSVTLLEGGVSKSEFVMFLNGHKGADEEWPNVITASFDPDAPNYFANVMNKDPDAFQRAGHYLYAHYDIPREWAVVTGSGIIANSVAGAVEPDAFLTTGSLTRNSGSATVPSYENWEDRFTTPRTPFIVSQRVGGKPVKLFRFHAIDDGAVAAGLYKISIENITPPDVDGDYGTFDVVVRRFDDTDASPEVLERFSGVTLDPGSDRYIARVIGDVRISYDFDARPGERKLVVDGQFEGTSAYIRVEVTDDVDAAAISPSLLPLGFSGPWHLVTSGSAPLTTIVSDGRLAPGVTNPLHRTIEPPVPYRRTLAVGTGANKKVDSSLYWGVQLERVGPPDDPNASKVKSEGVVSHTRHYPFHQTSWMNMWVGDNDGVADTSENGVLDADRFNNNLFTLENVRVVTGSNGLADSTRAVDWTYVRDGVIAVDPSTKTRAFSVDDLAVSSVRSLMKFTTFMQGGFDGVNIFIPHARELTNTAIIDEVSNTSRGLTEGPTVSAYRTAIDMIADTMEVDVGVVTIPGIRHRTVTDRLIDAVEDRFDAVAVIDVEEYKADATDVRTSSDVPSTSTTAQQFNARGVNSSFAAAYYPNVVMVDPFSGVETTMPASVAALGAISKSDALGFPWFAPAGYNRAVVDDAVDVAVNLNKANLDTLYESRINPITKFAGSDGIVVWGQRTTFRTKSSLEKLNIRRLLIEVRRRVRTVANSLIFEPNVPATLDRFNALVEPILAQIQAQRGLDRYVVLVDASTTTPADVQNNTIRGKIVLKPRHGVEFIDVDFVVGNSI